MQTITATINGIAVTAPRGSTIMQAASDNGIYIPTLCKLKDLAPKANCRLCIVQVQGARTYLPACATELTDGMVIHTDSPGIRASRKLTLELLLARHAEDCHLCLRQGNSRCADLDPKFCESCFFCDCERDGFCELQALAREYEVDKLPFELELPQFDLDKSTGSIIRNPNKCIKCRRCIDICGQIQGVYALSVVNRGQDEQIRPVGSSLMDSPCVRCGRCIDACPTGAIFAREKIDEVVFRAHSYNTPTAALVSGSVVERLAQISRLQPEEINLRAIAAGLKKIGVDHVLSEEDILADMAPALEARIQEALSGAQAPVIAVASYGALQFVRKVFPELEERLLQMPSPQQYFGEMIRGQLAGEWGMDPADVYTISVTNIHENAAQAQECGSVSYVIDADELFRMFTRTGVNIMKIVPRDFDRPIDVPTPVPTLCRYLQPDWTVSQQPEQLQLSIGGDTVDVIRCRNLGQARMVLRQVQSGTVQARLIILTA